MKKVGVVYLGLCLLLSIGSVRAQRSELGAMAGASFYLGELNKIPFSQSKFAAGIFYRYNIDTRWAIRTGLNYMALAADDKKTKNPRNLNFRNNIFDFSVMAEINFLNFFIGSKKEYRFTPYLTAGVAVFFHNPQAYYFEKVSGNTIWVDLQPLHTEGQGMTEYSEQKNYSLYQFAIPFGIGFKYSVSKWMSIGIEWTMRKTFTDYIDDVGSIYVNPALLMAEYGELSAYFSDPSTEKRPVGSYRGNPSNKDWYSMAAFSISFKIGTPEAICPSYKASAIDKLKKRR